LQEADRLARVFQIADTFLERSIAEIGIAHAAGQSYLGHDVSKEFSEVMYAGGSGKMPSIVEISLAMLVTCSIKASDLHYRFKFLIKYLEETQGKPSMQSFIQKIREDTNAEPHWQSSLEEVYSNTIFLLCCDYLIIFY
jgi:hypothetical protein